MKEFAQLALAWRLVGYASALLFLVITTLISTNVLARLIFESPFSWIPELTRHLMIWLAFLGASVALRLRGHLGLDLFGHVRERRFQTAVELLSTAVVIAVAYVLIDQGWTLVGRVARQTSSALGYSMSYPYAAIPAGGVLMVLAALDALRERLIELWRR
jgi:TRAP-type transport system small permease protein